MDVEGYEIPLFWSWWLRREMANIPTQILVESTSSVHFAADIQNDYMKQHNPDKSTDHKRLIQNAAELILLTLMLMEMGCIVVAKENNPLYSHCVELVLVCVPPQDLHKKKYYQQLD